MLTKCIIVDDEPLAINLLKRHINEISSLELIASFNNAMNAFEYIKNETIDLIFLDIQMPVLSGIDFVKSIQNPPGIIFTTANREYAVESYELDAVDYLVKPITFSRFFNAVNKYYNLINLDQRLVSSLDPSKNQLIPENNFIYVNANKKHIKVEFKEILFIESIKDYIRIHTNKNNIVTKNKISDFEKKLPNIFLRIHRSFIVNTNKVTAFTAKDVEINNREIPIGSSYKKEVLKFLL